MDTLRTAGGDGRLTAEELYARVERALSARTQGEPAALVADLSAATATKDVLVVKQTGGKWTRAGRQPTHSSLRSSSRRASRLAP